MKPPREIKTQLPVSTFYKSWEIRGGEMMRNACSNWDCTSLYIAIWWFDPSLSQRAFWAMALLATSCWITQSSYSTGKSPHVSQSFTERFVFLPFLGPRFFGKVDQGKAPWWPRSFQVDAIDASCLCPAYLFPGLRVSSEFPADLKITCLTRRRRWDGDWAIPWLGSHCHHFWRQRAFAEWFRCADQMPLLQALQ